METVFRLSPRICVLPILHASGDMAQEVREALIGQRVDCLAVPLPRSVEDPVERAIEALPKIHLVMIPEFDEHGAPAVSFVPVDPCQAVIMGIRVAMGEDIPRAYIDREVARFEPTPVTPPDPFALKGLSLAAFSAAVVSALRSPAKDSQQWWRVCWMAFRLHELELDHEAILCLCSLADWPWLRMAYQERLSFAEPETVLGSPEKMVVAPGSLYFVLGELPFLTELYERRRAEVRSDRTLSIDGVKELLIETRNRWKLEQASNGGAVIDWVTPQLLQTLLQYVRNLTLFDRRLTPDLYTLVLAAKQTAGDSFAITLLETAKSYSYQTGVEDGYVPVVSAGIEKLELPGGRVVSAKNRLQGPPLVWRSIDLRPKPARRTSRRWSLLWNPFRQCSWPPEDQKIESFHSHVRQQARAIVGADLAKVEKFTASLKDGIDLRETLRHRFTGRSQRPSRHMEIYVKEFPPARGNVDAVVFLFDTPADPDHYSWKATWYAEHAQESTLCFFATPFLDNMVGPGIGQSSYGGALFLYPPRPIPDIWTDASLEFAQTLEERLIAGAALHSSYPHVALVTPVPARARWRHIARQLQRRLVPIPLGRFSAQTIDRLRRFHVLNGHEIRSYAARFIRE
jgi:hypothetical protein